MINCVIIEDEPLAQTGLLKLIKPFASLKVLKVCDDVPDFIEYQANAADKIDLLFLDIELPGTNGIDFLRRSCPDAAVIISTAYNHYAIEGYELNVLDYLLKPISKQRFEQAVQKAESYLHLLHSKSNAPQDFIYIRSEKVIEKVFFDEIMIVEAMRNHVIYHCQTRKLISYNSLKNAQQSLPSEQFIKIQKSFIINKSKIQKIGKGFVTINNKAIAINRDNRNEIIQRLTQH